MISIQPYLLFFAIGYHFTLVNGGTIGGESWGIDEILARLIRSLPNDDDDDDDDDDGAIRVNSFCAPLFFSFPFFFLLLLSISFVYFNLLKKKKERKKLNSNLLLGD